MDHKRPIVHVHKVIHEKTYKKVAIQLKQEV